MIFGGFSSEAIADRNNDAKAKLQITADFRLAARQALPLKENVDEALAKARRLRNASCFRGVTAEPRVDMHAGRDFWWHELMPQASADCPADRSTAKRRCSSSTPAVRPANPKASSTRPPATTCSRRKLRMGV